MQIGYAAYAMTQTQCTHNHDTKSPQSSLSLADGFTNLFTKFRQHVQCEEVNWENVRCLPSGECVSVDGTHLGHNIPAAQCENLEELPRASELFCL